MGNLLWLMTTVYFLTIILVIYHLQQQELDRIQRELDEVSARKKFGES